MMKLIILSLLFFQNSNLLAKEQLLDEIVAVVEEGVILRSELDRAVNNIVQQLQARGTQLPPKSEIDTQVLEKLILQELQIQKADQAGVRISDAEIDAALTQVAAKNKLTLDQMKMAIENDGMSFAEFRSDMRKELKTERVRNGFASQNVKVSEHEIDLFLADNELSQSEVRLGHILISLKSDANEEATKKAKERANKIYQDLTNGKDFNNLAILHSAGQNAKDGGDLGWRLSSEIPTMFADQIRAMKAGEFTHPVRSAGGFHIVRLTDIREQTSKLITQFSARHILVMNTELVTPSQGMELINDINTRIQSGEDFAKLAEEKSDDVNSAPLGGDLGWFQLNEFGETFGNIVGNLDDQEISSPFQTQVGWHIIQRLGKRENDVTDEFKRAQAEQALHAKKLNEEIETWISEIRGEAFVEIRI